MTTLVASSARVKVTSRSRSVTLPVTVGAGPASGAARSSTIAAAGEVALLVAASVCLTRTL